MPPRVRLPQTRKQRMTHMQLRNTIAAATAFAALLFSAERFDNHVRNKFFAGFAGDQAALAEGMKDCEDMLARDPKHAEARVWYGSGQMAQSAQLMRTD